MNLRPTIVSGILTFFLFPLTLYGKFPPFLPKIEEKIQFKTFVKGKYNLQKELIINVRRFKNQGPPVILSHALILNNLGMRPLGYLLWKAGFDVWMPNSRGHGNGKERSLVIPYVKNDYRFNKLLTEDMPLIFNSILDRTNQKVTLIGYSMGGMLWEKFLSGVSKFQDKMVINHELSHKRNQKVKKFIAITPPQEFKSINPNIYRLLRPFMPLFKYGHYFIPLTSNWSPEDSSFSISERIRRQFLKILSPLLPYILPKGILTRGHIDPKKEEVFWLTKDQISQAHTDLIYDFISWMDEGYFSFDGRLNYRKNKFVEVPSLIFLATEDELAPARNLYKEVIKSYPYKSDPRFIWMCGRAHLDIVLSKSVSQVAKHIIDFINLDKDQFLNGSSAGVVYSESPGKDFICKK